MTEIVEQAVDYLQAKRSDMTVLLGFEDGMAETPLKRKLVFVSAHEIDNGVFTLRTAVHFPVIYGATSAVNCAEQLVGLYDLSECPFTVSSYKIKGAVYSAETFSYVAVIYCTVDQNTQPVYHFYAYDFEENSYAGISASISEFKVLRKFSPYPVMTIFSDIPNDVLFGSTVYEITLCGLETQTARQLSSSGEFTLRLNSEQFERCRCIKSSEKNGLNADVTLLGYKLDDDVQTQYEGGR